MQIYWEVWNSRREKKEEEEMQEKIGKKKRNAWKEKCKEGRERQRVRREEERNKEESWNGMGWEESQVGEGVYWG